MKIDKVQRFIQKQSGTLPHTVGEDGREEATVDVEGRREPERSVGHCVPRHRGSPALANERKHGRKVGRSGPQGEAAVWEKSLASDAS